jgi:hypothetical protein
MEDWLSENIPRGAWPDRVLASDLADRVMIAAERSGIAPRELDEEIGSVFSAVLRSMKERK